MIDTRAASFTQWINSAAKLTSDEQTHILRRQPSIVMISHTSPIHLYIYMCMQRLFDHQMHQWQMYSHYRWLLTKASPSDKQLAEGATKLISFHVRHLTWHSAGHWGICFAVTALVISFHAVSGNVAANVIRDLLHLGHSFIMVTLCVEMYGTHCCSLVLTAGWSTPQRRWTH